MFLKQALISDDVKLWCTSLNLLIEHCKQWKAMCFPSFNLKMMQCNITVMNDGGKEQTQHSYFWIIALLMVMSVKWKMLTLSCLATRCRWIGSSVLRGLQFHTTMSTSIVAQGGESLHEHWRNSSAMRHKFLHSVSGATMCKAQNCHPKVRTYYFLELCARFSSFHRCYCPLKVAHLYVGKYHLKYNPSSVEFIKTMELFYVLLFPLLKY